jgi:hypothetical protein
VMRKVPAAIVGTRSPPLVAPSFVAAPSFDALASLLEGMSPSAAPPPPSAFDAGVSSESEKLAQAAPTPSTQTETQTITTARCDPIHRL